MRAKCKEEKAETSTLTEENCKILELEGTIKNREANPVILQMK